MSALKYSLTGKQVHMNVPFVAQTSSTVMLTTGGFSGANYTVQLTPIAANGAALPTKFGIANKLDGKFDVITSANFTGSFDVVVSG